MINEDRKKLYDALSSEYDLGTYEEFERNIGDSVKRKKLYDVASADYDLGDFESYSQRIGPTHKESLDAFTAEHGSWLNDFEARDSAETKKMVASSRSGLYMPSENAISGEERKRYMELHKQEEALKKAWFTSDEYLAQKDADALFLSNVQKDLSRQRVEYAQANPPIKQEGLFQINPYAVRGVEADTELERFATASRLMDDAIKMHNAPSRYDDKNVFLKFGKGAGDVLSDADFWTAGLTEIADNLGVRDVLSTVQEKLGNLNDLSEEAIENILSPAEKAVLQAWAINTQEQLKRKDDLSRAYQAGQGATESLGFMAEFALTGGIGKAATEGVEQMVKWLGKKALTKVGGMTDDVAAKVLKETGEKIAQSTVGKYGVGLAESLAEAAGRTGVMPSTFRNISEKATEIETDENGNNYLVKMNDAFAKGYVGSFIENLSEGGRVNALGTLFGDVAGKIPAYKKMVDKFSHTKASELWDAFNSSGVMNTLRAGGWHGLGEEYLEEWYGNALRTLTGVDKEALKDFATVDNQIVTLTSFLPMTIFGGTVSTAQVLSANKDLEKKAAALKSALMERGYDEAQANNMIDMMRGAAPAEVSETLTPIVNSVANRNTNEAAALMKPVGEFAAAVQRWQSFNTKYNYQEQEQRDGLRAQMEENLGQFWQQDENGRQTVQRGVNEKGEVVYMLGKPSVEDVEAGVTSEVAAVTSDGRKVFVNPSEYQLEDELEMNTFLGNEIMAEKGNQEQARMIEEKEAKIAAIRETAVPGTAVNIGTAEAPMQAIVLQRNPDGVIVNTPDGQTRQMTYEEFGNYVGVNAVPMTDAQIDEHEADVLTADRAQREAALDQEYDNDDAALDELAEAEDEIEQAIDSNILLPMKADGSVDQTALWNNDPERWAQWNDEQRQDGGVNSLAYVSGAIAKEQAKIAELQAAYAAESDFDARDAIEKEIADTQARVERLTAIQQGYVARAEAGAAPVVEAELVVPRVAAQMSEQELEQIDTQHQARLDAAKSTTAKREAMQNYINEISQGSVPMTLISMDEYEQVMKDAGCTPNQIAQVKRALKVAKLMRMNVPAFFVPGVGIFAFVENIPNIEQLRLTYVHERQHQFTAADNKYLNALLQLGLSRERLAEIVYKLSTSEFYSDKDAYTLADEVISYAMERAYTYEDFSVALQELGIEQEIIDIITEIDNEQRFDNTAHPSRRRGRTNLHDNSSGSQNGAENDRNSKAVPGRILDEQGDRPSGDSVRGNLGGRQGSTGEGAEVTPEGPSFRITPEMDADYRNAIEQGDEEIAQQMVNDAAEEWAKDSKVRDEYGNLAVQYHGSRDFGFTVFNTDPKTQNLGSHFGTEEAAKVFDGKGDRTYRVYLNITNPWIPRYEDFWTDADQVYAAAVADLANDLAQAGNEEAAKIYDEIVAEYPMARNDETLNEWFIQEHRDDTYTGAETLHPKLRRLLEIGGYDGVRYNNWMEDPGNDSWVALYPEQIKSAEVATFDDDNKLIPLSERFTEGVDLRFRTAATNPEVNLTEETRQELSDKSLVMDGGAIMSEDYAALKHALDYETPIERNTDLDQVRFSIGTRNAHIANYRKHPNFEERVVEILERLAERMTMNELVYGVVSTATQHTYGKKLPGSVAGPLRSNEEYIITFDLDTSCPRTFQYLNLVKQIEKRIGRPLTQVESIQLIEMMRMYGQQIPCVYCYAENKRQALKQYYTDFMEARHGVLSAASDEEALQYMYGRVKDSEDPREALTKAAYEVFVEWRKNPRGMYNPTIKMMWNQYTNDRNSILSLLDRMYADKAIGTSTSDTKITGYVAAEFGVTNAKALRVIEEVVAEWKWDVIEEKEHDQYTPVDEDDWGVNERALEVWRDMTSYAKSASSAKSVIRYTPYTDELKAISQEDKDYINGMGGVRMHSSNDFRIDYVFDYFQFMADMALYKMFGHTYTKSPEFVRIFGNSGYKINMSIAAYQDENGNIRPNVDEGFDWEEAKTLRQLFPNAGTMLMATSDEQIQMALDSDWIDMCIPFHHSGLPKAVWYNMRMWQDYTSIQKELFLNSSEMKEALKADGVMIPKNAKADDIAKLYNDHFGIKVLYDKKGKRIRPHFLPGPTVVDGHPIPGHNNDHQRYLDLCKEYGVKPRFAGMQVRDNSPEGGGRVIDVTEHPRYMIFIKETSRTDSPQTPIQFNFDQPSEALGGKSPIDYAFDELEARAMAESGIEGKAVNDIYNSLKKDQFGIADQFINSIIKHKNETGEDYPLDYITPESRDWFLVQRKALEEAFKDVETIPYHRNEYDEQGNLTEGKGLERDGVIDLIEEAKKAQKKHEAKTKKSSKAKKEDIRFRVSNENQAIFVSNAARAVEGIKQEKATPEQWLKMIEKNGGLKAGEDKWMGLSDFLKASDKKTLTKQEVLDFVNEHMIVIEEQHYSINAEDDAERAHGEISERLQDKFDNFVDEYYQDHDWDGETEDARAYAIEKLREEMGDTFPYTIELEYGNVYLTFPYEEEDDLVKWAEKTGVKYTPGVSPINDTRLNYTTDGLGNKHEIALTIPTIERWNEHDSTHFGDAGDGRAVAWVRFGDTWKFAETTEQGDQLLAYVNQLREKYGIEEEVEITQFGNINLPDDLLMAISNEELNEFKRLEQASMSSTDKTEQRILVIDEIQSKRHQEGREKGYTTKEDVAQRKAARARAKKATNDLYDYIGELVAKYPGTEYSLERVRENRGRFTEEENNKLTLLIMEHNYAELELEKHRGEGVPDAPFDKNWHELAMKRMLRYAAENGYDAIAWTKGEQQAERYGIGKVVSSVGYRRTEDDKRVRVNMRGGESLLFDVDILGKVTEVHRDGGVVTKGMALSEIVGSDLAKQIGNYEGEVDERGDYNIKSEDFRIGGEGMKGFYDKMLPAFMNKYGKKWGIKVEDIDLPNLGKSGRTMHSVPVTEEMKASVMEGQVMFRIKGADESAKDFIQEATDNFYIKYNTVAPASVVYANSRKMIADALGITLDDLTDDLYKKIRKEAKESGAFFVSMTLKKGDDTIENRNRILIFAKDDVNMTAKADRILFHENTHGLVKEMPELLDLGQWLLSSDERITSGIADSVRVKYDEADWAEEMVCDYVGIMMSLGKGQEALNNVTDEYKPLLNTVYERFGYNPEDEDPRRRSERNRDARELQMRNTENEGADSNSILFRSVGIAPEVRDEMDAISATAIVRGNYLKAPNGADTNLTPEQWALVRTKNFKQWFGDWEQLSELKEIEARKVEWLSAENIAWAKGKTLQEIEAKFGNEPKAVAYLPVEYLSVFGEEAANLADNRVYSGKGYYIDHAANHHHAVSPEKYINIQEVINNYDHLKRMQIDGHESIVFIKKIDRWNAVSVQLEVGENGRIVWHKSFYDQKKEPYKSLPDVQLPKIVSPEGGVSSISPTENSVAAISLQSRDDNAKLVNFLNPANISKVIDENGEPMVVYHGTPNEFWSFDKDKIGSTNDSGFWGEGFYFTSQEALAVHYAEGDRVLPVFLNIRNPHDFAFFTKEYYDHLERFGMFGDKDFSSSRITEELTKEGKDGVIRRDSYGGHAEYVVFSPNQIKSATDNTGEFSAEDKDIRFRTKSDVNTNPTEAQKKAGNYKMGHIRLDGYNITIENPKGSVRRGTDSKGNAWENTLNNDYGYIRGTEGVDGDHIDVYLSDNPTEGNVFVIDQVNPETREFDEHKVMYGFNSAEEAREAYLANFSEGWNGLGTITEVSKDEFKKWIESSHRKTKPFSEYKSVKTIEVQSEGEDMEDNLLPSTGTPTDEVVTNGLQLTPAQTAEVAANIFAALPEESRKKITEGLNGNILGLKDAILQIPTSLASKENWNEEDKQMADVVAEEMTKIAGEMTRPFSAEEGLWLLYNNLNKGADLISQASRALVQRNLGFDAETLAKQEQAKEDVRFRTVGDANSNAQASLYNRGAVNVWTRLKESFVDMQASVEELVKAIEKRSGKVAQGFENILLALNQQSSKGLAAMESYTQKFLNPMFDEIRRIMDETKMKYEDVVRYVILKHGLERNKKLAQRDARAHYQEIYDDIISKITGMTAAQKRTYLTNAQLKEGDAKAELAVLKAVDMSAMTDEEKREHKKKLAAARKAVEEAEEYLKRAQKIASMTEQEAQDELDKIFEKIENGTDSVFKEMRENDYSGISSMFYDQLDVNRKNFSTEEQYQAALMEAKKDRYSSLKDIEAAAEAEVKSFEGKTNTKELWKRINAATKETLRQQYEANMISKDQYLNLRDMFEYYVPLRGFKDNTAEDMYTYYRKPNSTGYAKPILGAEGRKTEAESPFGWIAAMAGSAIASNVKNEAKLALYYFVSNRPENGIATISKTWFVHTAGDVDERGKKIFRPAYPPFSEDLSSAEAKAQYEIWQANMKELQKQGQAYEAGQRLNLGNAVVNISDANKPEHIVNVKVGGKDYTIIINGNPRAAQAINGDLNIEGTAQDYSALFGPVLRWMSSVNTSYNPEFWITNMMRDMAFTMMAVNIKEDPAYRRKFSKNYRKAFKVISLVAKNEKGTIGDSYLEQQYKDFVKYGGVTGYTQIKDSETWEQEIENYLSSTDPESLKSGKVMRGMRSVFHAAHRFGESLEQVSRFAAFLTARETGKSINEAIDDAKEITVNFNRKGSGKMITLEEAKYLTGKNGQPLTKPQQWMVVGLSSIAPLGRRFIMFFNAAIQGLNATYKLMKKNPKRFTGWALGYAAVGMMNAVLHAMLDDDDDYLDIPQYERRNSLMIGGNGAYFKWALPQEARAFYALGDLAVETVMGRNPHQNVLGEALKIGTEILPVNPSEGWKAFMPSVAIPFIELALNEDYKGAPIYNEQKWLSEDEKERTAKWSSAYQGTGWTYVKIAQGLNFITGGDKHDAGLINLQPEKLEHLVQSAFGGTIRTADKFINTISAMIDPEEDVTIRQTPFLNRFLTINDERFKNVHVNDVFDYYKADAEHALTLEKQYIKDRDMDSLTELRSSDEYQWAKIYGKYKKSLKAIQDKIKVADGTAEKKELMKQQDELKKRMIKEISEL